MDSNADEKARRLQHILKRGPWLKWFEGKDFTEDWSSLNFTIWATLLGPMKERPQQVLEIGSFEGRSAIFWLEFLPDCHLTCIDHFATTKKRNGSEIEARFDRNTAAYGGRLTKIKSSSAVALSQLVDAGRKFDVIFVDGSHYRDNVLIDCLLSWKLLPSGGILILDDYLLDLDRDKSERPKDAIDCFMALHEGEFQELARSWQLILKKL